VIAVAIVIILQRDPVQHSRLAEQKARLIGSHREPLGRF
jgi:hypothetical protein